MAICTTSVCAPNSAADGAGGLVMPASFLSPSSSRAQTLARLSVTQPVLVTSLMLQPVIMAHFGIADLAS